LMMILLPGFAGRRRGPSNQQLQGEWSCPNGF
jgi:hypothetical protein